jgi:hypothetical protein
MEVLFDGTRGGPWFIRPLPNVWLGVSIENARYTWRADVLREIPAAIRFISAEPLLDSLWPSGGNKRSGHAPLDLAGIDWLIIGGESGPGARPCHLEHARELLEAANLENYYRSCGDLPPLAVFVKQLGAQPVDYVIPPDAPPREVRLKLRDQKGGDIDEWPADLRIREFPQSIGAMA